MRATRASSRQASVLSESRNAGNNEEEEDRETTAQADLTKTRAAMEKLLEDDEDEEMMDVDEEEEEEEQENKKAKKKPAKKDAKKKETEVEKVKQEKGKKAGKEEKKHAIEDYEAQLLKAIENAKGQKTLIKRLLSDKAEVVEKCDVNLLRRSIWEPNFMAVPDGRKLASYFYTKIGIDGLFQLVKKRLLEPGTTNTYCGHVGEMLVCVWKNIDKAVKETDDRDEKKALSRQLKQCEQKLTELSEMAIVCRDPVSSRAINMIRPLALCDRRRFEGLIFRTMQPVLWKLLMSPNNRVRYSAHIVLFEFFPVRDEENGELLLEQQYRAFADALVDDCWAIRALAAKQVPDKLAIFWSLVDHPTKRNLFNTLGDSVSMDSIVAVRLAVYEGLFSLIPVSAAMQMTEQLMKTICKRGINDRNERVREKCFDLLAQLRTHRFIRVLDVVDKKDVLNRLEAESSESVRKAIVKLLFGYVFSQNGSADEKLGRLALLAMHGRQSALTFCRLAFPLNMLSVKQSADHIRYLLITVYKRWRHVALSGGQTGNGSLLVDGSMNMDDTVGTLSGPADGVNIDESDPTWQRDKVLLECAVVQFMSIRKALSDPQYAPEKEQLEKLLNKLFKRLFAFFRNSSILGTAMAIGGCLSTNDMEGIAAEVLSHLRDCSVEDGVVESYLEAAASWNVDALLDIIDNGLEAARRLAEGQPEPANKKHKNSRLTQEERVQQAARYLRFLLHSPSASQRVAALHISNLIVFHDKLKVARSMVEERLDVDNDDNSLGSAQGGGGGGGSCPLELPLVCDLFELRGVLSVFLVECLRGRSERGVDCESESARLVAAATEDLQWLQEEVVMLWEGLQESGDEGAMELHQMMCETGLRCCEYMVSAHHFSSSPAAAAAVDSETETTDSATSSSQSDELQFGSKYLASAWQLVKTMSSRHTPARVLSHALSTVRHIVDTCGATPASAMLGVISLRRACVWLAMQVYDENELPGSVLDQIVCLTRIAYSHPIPTGGREGVDHVETLAANSAAYLMAKAAYKKYDVASAFDHDFEAHPLAVFFARTIPSKHDKFRRGVSKALFNQLVTSPLNQLEKEGADIDGKLFMLAGFLNAAQFIYKTDPRGGADDLELMVEMCRQKMDEVDRSANEGIRMALTELIDTCEKI